MSSSPVWTSRTTTCFDDRAERTSRSWAKMTARAERTREAKEEEDDDDDDDVVAAGGSGGSSTTASRKRGIFLLGCDA